MTLLDQRPTESDDRQAQALFEEARQRRQRRWLLTGITVSAVLGAAVLVLAISHGYVGKAQSSGGHRRPLPHVAAPTPDTATVTSALKGPEALAIAPNGGVLIDDQATSQIVEREPNGSFRVIAGNGHAGFAGDRGPAIAAELNLPVGLAVGPDGTVYVADLNNDRIRAVSPNGTISTVAYVSQPSALAVGPTGTLIAPPTTTLPEGMASDISVAGASFAFDPDAIAVSSAGDLYVANFSPKALLRFAPNGGSATLVGSTSVYAGQTYVTRAGLDAAPDGSIVVANYGTFALDRATGSALSVIRAFSLDSVPGVQGAFRPSGVAAAPNGQIYVDTDGENGGTNTPALIAIDPDGKTNVLDVGSPPPRPNR
jgi:serine/threonine-protein kinase